MHSRFKRIHCRQRWLSSVHFFLRRRQVRHPRRSRVYPPSLQMTRRLDGVSSIPSHFHLLRSSIPSLHLLGGDVACRPCAGVRKQFWAGENCAISRPSRGYPPPYLVNKVRRQHCLSWILRRYLVPSSSEDDSPNDGREKHRRHCPIIPLQCQLR